MTTFEYEMLVAEHFRSKGYSVELTGKTGDLGLDILALQGIERVAIQTKMYGKTRRVNAEMILLLEGTRNYFDCTKAVMATDGMLMPTAEKVANKLHIEVLKLSAVSQGNHKLSVDHQPCSIGDDVFSNIWIEHVLPLNGQVLQTLGQGRENIIKNVDMLVSRV